MSGSVRVSRFATGLLDALHAASHLLETIGIIAMAKSIRGSMTNRLSCLLSSKSLGICYDYGLMYLSPNLQFPTA